MRINLTIEAGLLTRRPLRTFLEEALADGNITSYREIKGWLVSDFVIRGAMPSVQQRLKRWIAAMAEATK